LHTPTRRDEESEGEYRARLAASVRIGKDRQEADLREKQLRNEMRDEARELRREEERHDAQRRHAKKNKKEKEICEA
jgi:hypothetical protein